MSIDALADMSAPNRWRDSPAPPPTAGSFAPLSRRASPASRRSATVDAWLARAAAARSRQRALLLLGERASGHYQIFAQVQARAGGDSEAETEEGSEDRGVRAAYFREGPCDPAWREKIGVEVLQRAFDSLLALLACPEARPPTFDSEAIALMRELGATFAQGVSPSSSETPRATLRRLQKLWKNNSVQSVVSVCQTAKLMAVDKTMQALQQSIAESTRETFVPTAHAVVCASASGPFQGSPMVEEVVFRAPLNADGNADTDTGANLSGCTNDSDSGVSDLRIVPANFRPGKRLPQVVQRLFLDVDAVAVVIETPATASLTSEQARAGLIEAAMDMLRDAVQLVSGKKRAEVQFCVLLNRCAVPNVGGGSGGGKTLAGEVEQAARSAFPEVAFTDPAAILVDSTNAANVVATMCLIARNMPASMPSTEQAASVLFAYSSVDAAPARGVGETQSALNDALWSRRGSLWLVVAVIMLALAMLVAAASNGGVSWIYTKI